MAALAYPLWFAVFPMVYITPDKRNQPFLRFHAYQGAAIGLFGVVGLSFMRLLLGVLFRWLILFDILLYPVLKFAEYGVLLAMLIGALSAWGGRRVEFPFISQAVRNLFPEERAIEPTES